MNEIWMRNHLVSDSICNVVNLLCPISFLHGMTNNVRFTYSVGDGKWAVYD